MRDLVRDLFDVEKTVQYLLQTGIFSDKKPCPKQCYTLAREKVNQSSLASTSSTTPTIPQPFSSHFINIEDDFGSDIEIEVDVSYDTGSFICILYLSPFSFLLSPFSSSFSFSLLLSHTFYFITMYYFFLCFLFNIILLFIPSYSSFLCLKHASSKNIYYTRYKNARASLTRYF